jgi:hypothetical protein
VSTDGDVAAVILLRTTRIREDMTPVFAAIDGVSRVECLRRPYEFVIHAAGRAQVEVIKQLSAVTKAEVCWLSHLSQGGSG